MSIVSLSNILANRQKKKKTNTDKYTRFQKTILLFQISHKITISKAFLYINSSLPPRRSRSANPSQGKNHKKGKEKEKRKRKEKEKRKETEKEKESRKKKEKEKEKRGNERYNGGNGT